MSYDLIALQEAVQSVLAADATLATLLGSPLQIYDFVPAGATYPRIVYGDQRAVALDTKTSTGLEVAFSLLVYSRARGRRELRQVEAAIYAALHQQALAVSNCNFCQCQFTQSTQRLEPDGLTYRSRLDFRITLTD